MMKRSIALVMLALPLASCAYYNTYYLAKKYYDQATDGRPYVFEKTVNPNTASFTKSIEYTKKLIAQYPNHKLVDDAYLLWARSLIGSGDARQAVKMLEDFPVRFSNSPIRPEAEFYLGVANRQTHKYEAALRSLDAFVVLAPRHELAPYAHLERARALMSLERPEEAATAAGQVVEHFPKSVLVDQARVARAEARFAQGSFDLARQDFHDLGQRSRTDEERFNYLLREADCLESDRKYDGELQLLKDALAHERAPAIADTSINAINAIQAATPGQTTLSTDRYGRLLIRVGTAHLLAGRFDEALDSYRRVIASYPRSPLAAEAQYRVGYAYENFGDDFEKARAEYSHVREQSPSSTFVTDASNRLASLERLTATRSAGADSLEKKAESEFLLAELYLFQLNKPERALEQYQKIARDFSGTEMAAKAMNAEGWVLSRKLKRRPEADSLFWGVVHEYPATEAQLAARDYLELAGVEVPEGLIKMPVRKVAPVDSTQLAAPSDSAGASRVPGAPVTSALDSLNRVIFYQGGAAPPPSGARVPSLQPHPPGMLGDPNRDPMGPRRLHQPRFPGDSLGVATPVDTTRDAAPRDTSYVAPPSVPADSTSAPPDSAAADTSKGPR